MKAAAKPADVYIGITEAAVLFTVNRDWLQRWATQKNPMPHVRRGKQKHIFINPEEVRNWMIVNGKAGYKQTLLKNAGELTDVAKRTEPTAAELGIGAAAQRARVAEFVAFQAYVQARDSNNGLREEARLKLYVETCKALKELEKIYDDRETASKEIWEAVQKHIAQWIEPIKSLLDGMPRALAGRVNPQDPAFAETALREWLNSQLLPMMAREIKS